MTNTTPRESAARVIAMIENNQKERELARETQEAEEAIARAREIERKIERMNEY
jgi:hypothetical protein